MPFRLGVATTGVPDFLIATRFFGCAWFLSTSSKLAASACRPVAWLVRGCRRIFRVRQFAARQTLLHRRRETQSRLRANGASAPKWSDSARASALWQLRSRSRGDLLELSPELAARTRRSGIAHQQIAQLVQTDPIRAGRSKSAVDIPNAMDWNPRTTPSPSRSPAPPMPPDAVELTCTADW